MADRIQVNTIAYSQKDEKSADAFTDFTSLYLQHRLTIYRYILARIGHMEDAQDLCAQVFLKAYQNLATYRAQSLIIYWLIGIARHAIIDYHRNQRSEIPLTATGEIASPQASLEEFLEKRNRLKRVADALNALSEDRREAISMRLFAGLSNPEIAEIMGKSPDAVAMLVHRGIQDLKVRLGGEEISS